MVSGAQKPSEQSGQPTAEVALKFCLPGQLYTVTFPGAYLLSGFIRARSLGPVSEFSESMDAKAVASSPASQISKHVSVFSRLQNSLFIILWRLLPSIQVHKLQTLVLSVIDFFSVVLLLFFEIGSLQSPADTGTLYVNQAVLKPT